MGKAQWLSVESRESPHVEGEVEMAGHRLGGASGRLEGLEAVGGHNPQLSCR